MGDPRCYVVTGSASGIGAATCAQLRAEGQRVIGVDRPGTDAEVQADLSAVTGRAHMIEQVDQLSGGVVDGLIASAGVGGKSGNPSLIVAVNYFGVLATMEGIRPMLARTAAPRAAVVSSMATLMPEADDPVVLACLDGDEQRAQQLVHDDTDAYRAYAGTKRALSRWVRRMAPTPQWAGAGIALNAVAPGVIITPLSTYSELDPAQRAEALKTVPMPLGGFGEPEHVASPLVWLTSEGNARVTGQVIFVDGGTEVVRRGEDIW